MPLDFVFLKYDVIDHLPFSFSVHTMDDRFSRPVVSSISLATPILTEQSTRCSEMEYDYKIHNTMNDGHIKTPIDCSAYLFSMFQRNSSSSHPLVARGAMTSINYQCTKCFHEGNQIHTFQGAYMSTHMQWTHSIHFLILCWVFPQTARSGK